MRAAHPQTAFSEARQGDRPGVQDRPEVSVGGHRRPAGGFGGLPGGAFRGHQPVRHPRQEGDHHAQGHAAGPSHSR